jgi:hypothetical protein
MIPSPLSRQSFALLTVLAAVASPAFCDGPANTPASGTPSATAGKKPKYDLPVVGIPKEGRDIGGERSLVTTQPSTAPTTRPRRRVVYNLPITGIPHEGRAIGGSRTVQDSLTLVAISPDDGGFTLQSAPALFWYISGPTKRRIEFALNHPKHVEPVLFKDNLASPATAGISRIDLAAEGIKLEPGVVYEWVIAVVQDEDRRSHDIVATGLIRLEESAPADPSAHDATLAPHSSDSLERCAFFAERGIWYDAFQAVSDAIQRNPDDAWAIEQRNALLTQIGLGKIISHRSGAGGSIKSSTGN